MVQALPVLRLLKLSHPEAAISWWISSELASLLEEDADVSETLLFDRKGWRNDLWFVPKLIRQVTTVRARRFDLVVDLQGLARSGLFAWMADGALTVGVEDWREGAPAFYDIRVPRPNERTHAVDWYLSLLRTLNVPVHAMFEWLPRKEKAAAAVEEKWPAKRRRVILNPGARWQNKRWPLEYFCRLAEMFERHHPEVEVVLLGGTQDKELGMEITRAAPGATRDLTGRTSLPELVEVIRTASVMITNDTGPMHIAAALRVPVVGLFGPTTPFRTGPYGQLDRAVQQCIPCVPCMKAVCSNSVHLECLKTIPPAHVFARAVELL